MTIDEVIKLLTRWQDGKDITSFDDVNRAVKLGIEALKREKLMRIAVPLAKGELLPGETKE